MPGLSAMPRLTAVVFVLLGVACVPAPVSNSSTEHALAAPARDGFPRVADALVATCGTLDCHGQLGRNLRLYGNHGLRLARTDDPGGAPTTAEEYDASYWSVIGLEPETLDEVVRAHGADPERLSLVRKPRGTERHKGGTLMQAGDALDRCLRSWIEGDVDAAACMVAAPQRPDAGQPN
jgi:hypothetical protein